MEKLNDLLRKAYELYGVNKTEFSKRTGIAYKTLEGWEKKGLSGIGKLLIESLIREKEQEILLQRKHIANSIEAYEYKKIKIYDERILKYKSNNPKDFACDLLVNLGIDVYEIEDVLINPKDNGNPHIIVTFTTRLNRAREMER